MVNDLLAGMPEQVVLVTHHLHLLEGFDRVVVLDSGRVIADGSPEAAVDSYTRLLA
jgi:biotin transport system ATP-binding protein